MHTLPGQGKALTVAGGSSVGSSTSSSSSSASTVRVMDGEDGLDSCLKRCRSLKTAAEVGCLLVANQISGIAHMDMWRASRPGASLELDCCCCKTRSLAGGKLAGHQGVCVAVVVLIKSHEAMVEGSYCLCLQRRVAVIHSSNTCPQTCHD